MYVLSITILPGNFHPFLEIPLVIDRKKEYN